MDKLTKFEQVALAFAVAMIENGQGTKAGLRQAVLLAEDFIVLTKGSAKNV